MKNIFKRDDGIKIIKKTERGVCGGTDATLDTKAPTQIISDEMTFFYVSSALNTYNYRNDGPEPLCYVSAFAARDADGVFLFIEKSTEFRRTQAGERTAAYVKKDIFPSLVNLVRERKIAKNNGFHSTTHGLPQNFGGEADIRYASGERISFSNNQTPIIDYETGVKINELFEKAVEGEKIKLPDVSDLSVIKYEETRKNGGYTKAELTLLSDGTGINKKESRYDDPAVYKSEKKIDAETVSEIKQNIKATCLFAWAGLPESGFSFGEAEKTLTFVFKNGNEIKVKDGKIVPDQISGGFFNVQLEITTKN